jgi:hypothetical protein
LMPAVSKVPRIRASATPSLLSDPRMRGTFGSVAA